MPALGRALAPNAPAAFVAVQATERSPPAGFGARWEDQESEIGSTASSVRWVFSPHKARHERGYAEGARETGRFRALTNPGTIDSDPISRAVALLGRIPSVGSAFAASDVSAVSATDREVAELMKQPVLDHGEVVEEAEVDVVRVVPRRHQALPTPSQFGDFGSDVGGPTMADLGSLMQNMDAFRSSIAAGGLEALHEAPPEDMAAKEDREEQSWMAAEPPPPPPPPRFESPVRLVDLAPPSAGAACAFPGLGGASGAAAVGMPDEDAADATDTNAGASVAGVRSQRAGIGSEEEEDLGAVLDDDEEGELLDAEEEEEQPLGGGMDI